MKNTLKTLALFTTGLVVGVVVRRVNRVQKQGDYLIVNLEKANLETIVDAYERYNKSFN